MEKFEKPATPPEDSAADQDRLPTAQEILAQLASGDVEIRERRGGLIYDEMPERGSIASSWLVVHKGSGRVLRSYHEKLNPEEELRREAEDDRHEERDQEQFGVHLSAADALIAEQANMAEQIMSRLQQRNASFCHMSGGNLDWRDAKGNWMQAKVTKQDGVWVLALLGDSRKVWRSRPDWWWSEDPRKPMPLEKI